MYFAVNFLSTFFLLAPLNLSTISFYFLATLSLYLLTAFLSLFFIHLHSTSLSFFDSTYSVNLLSSHLLFTCLFDILFQLSYFTFLSTLHLFIRRSLPISFCLSNFLLPLSLYFSLHFLNSIFFSTSTHSFVTVLPLSTSLSALLSHTL